MTVWTIIGFVASVACLSIWEVCAKMDERDAQNDEAYIRALKKILKSDREQRNSEDSFTQKWSA